MSFDFRQVEMSRVYGVCHYIIRVMYDAFFRGEFVGRENLPRHGAFMIASNHVSHLDPPAVGCLVPRQVCFFARKTLWKPGFASWWLTRVGTIPVDRDGADVGALKRTIAAVENGGIVILFPEGTRSPDGELQPAKAGIGMIACKTQATVVPVRIFDSFHAFGRGMKLPQPYRSPVVIGRPLAPAAYDDPKSGKQRYQVASDRIMAAITALERPRFPAV